MEIIYFLLTDLNFRVNLILSLNRRATTLSEVINYSKINQIRGGTMVKKIKKYKLLRVADTGLSWELKPLEFYDYPVGICFVDINHGWILTECGLVLKTIDGGKTWEQIFNFKSLHLKGLSFINQNEGYILSFDCEKNLTVIYKTLDGGKNWNELCAVLSMNFPEEVFFWNRKNGYIVSLDEGLSITKNGGNDWKKVELGFHPSYIGSEWVGGYVGHIANMADFNGDGNWEKSPIEFSALHNGVEYVDDNFIFGRVPFKLYIKVRNFIVPFPLNPIIKDGHMVCMSSTDADHLWGVVVY